MQGVVVGMLVAVTLVGLTRAAVAWRRRGSSFLWLQIAVGVAIGGIAAAVVVALRTDFIPDELELGMAVALVIVLAAGIVPLLLNRAR